MLHWCQEKDVLDSELASPWGRLQLFLLKFEPSTKLCIHLKSQNFFPGFNLICLLQQNLWFVGESPLPCDGSSEQRTGNDIYLEWAAGEAEQQRTLSQQICGKDGNRIYSWNSLSWDKKTLWKLLVGNVIQKLPSIRYLELLQNFPNFLSKILQYKVSSKEFLMPQRRKSNEKNRNGEK